MLFERIRHTQKPIFVFLAVMFGLGFVRSASARARTASTSASLFSIERRQQRHVDLGPESRVQSHPKDAGAWLRLARAYETGEPDEPGDLGLPELPGAEAEEPDRAVVHGDAARAARPDRTPRRCSRPRPPPRSTPRSRAPRRPSSLKLAAGAHASAAELPRPAGTDARLDARDERDHRLRPGDGLPPEAREARAEERRATSCCSPATPTPPRATPPSRRRCEAYLTLSPNLPKAQRRSSSSRRSPSSSCWRRRPGRRARPHLAGRLTPDRTGNRRAAV